MHALWFSKMVDVEVGPLTSSQLIELAREGKLHPDHLVRRSDSDKWATAARVRGLFNTESLTPTQRDAAISSSNSVGQSIVSVTASTDSADRPTGDSDWLDERYDLINIGKWRSEFGAIRWWTLFPIGLWLKDRPWSLVWVQLFTFAFCFPFLLIHYYQSREASLPEAAWAFSVYFAILWAGFLHRCMRPGTLSKRILVGTWFFTAILGVFTVTVISLIGRALPGFRELIAASESASIFGKLVGFTLAVGLVEEAAKALPVMWFASRHANGMRLPRRLPIWELSADWRSGRRRRSCTPWRMRPVTRHPFSPTANIWSCKSFDWSAFRFCTPCGPVFSVTL
jgi:hypothetical protein